MAFKRKADPSSAESVEFKKIGDSLTGIYLGATLWEGGKFGPTMVHLFNTSEGMKKAYSKEKGQLTQILAGEEGKNVLVTYAESRPSGKGNPMKVYTVDVDDEFQTLPANELLAQYEDAVEDTEEEVDEEPQYTAPPSRTASASAANQAKVQALLNRTKIK